MPDKPFFMYFAPGVAHRPASRPAEWPTVPHHTRFSWTSTCIGFAESEADSLASDLRFGLHTTRRLSSGRKPR